MTELPTSDLPKTYTFELLQAGVRDDCGDCFTIKALADAAESYDGQAWVTADFGAKTKDIQGALLSVEMVDDKIMAEVKLLPTPQGQAIAAIMIAASKEAVALAARGDIDEADWGPEEFVEGHKVRTIHKFRITGASLVRAGEKVK